MKTINEIYKEIKQLRDSLEEYIKTNDTSAAKVVLISNLNIYNDILNQLEESGVLEEEKLKDMALELACENIRDMYCSDYCIWARGENCKGRCCYEQYYDKEKILDQAKEKLEKEKQDARKEVL